MERSSPLAFLLMSAQDLPRPESIEMSRETAGKTMAIGLKQPNEKEKKEKKKAAARILSLSFALGKGLF